MADVTLTYKGNTIAEMNDSGTKTLKTAGKYCEGDINVDYVKPSGGSDMTLLKKMISGFESTDIIILPSDITEIRENAFSSALFKEIILPEGLKTIGGYAFRYCNKLESISLPDSVISIGIGTFQTCSKVTSVSLSTNIKFIEIDNSAFASCNSLSLIEIPSNIKYIRSKAFNSCISLTTVTFKGTPSSISADSFGNCANLTDIYVPWAEGAVANAPWGATNATIHYNTTT